jgi:polysaccharide pyruvyl transferase WcaK-like protein
MELLPVAFQPGEDEKVWLAAGWKGEVTYASEPLETFAAFDLVVSMRLHGCIVSTCLAIPWLGIAYDPKVSAFADASRWQFCCSPSDATRPLLEEKLNLLVSRRVEFSDKLHRIAGENRRNVEEDYARMAAAVSAALKPD